MKTPPPLKLNGLWETGIDRDYNTSSVVPGMATDPGRITPGLLWYRRRINLPAGAWSDVTLTLKGARFCPRIFVNGDPVSQSQGGMTETVQVLNHPSIKPGESVLLEIALLPLDAVDDGDASRIPKADRWRSNISSCLWDEVLLRLHGPTRIKKAVPWTDIQADSVTIEWELDRLIARDTALGTSISESERLVFEIVDDSGKVVVHSETSIRSGRGRTQVALEGKCSLWSPDTPVCYALKCILVDKNGIVDELSFTWGLRSFCVDGTG